MGTWAKYRDWWEKHREEVLRKRKERYRTDEEYRVRLKESARRRQAMLYSQKMSSGGVARSRTRKPVLVRLNGEEVTMFGVGIVAARMGKLVQTIVRWEREGVIPQTPFRADNGMRLYTEEMVRVLEEGYAHNKRIVNIVDKQAFYNEIQEGWRRLNIPLDKRIKLDIIRQ